MTEAMPLDSIELAITVDELLLWDGTPVPRGYTAKGIVGSLLQALAEHELDGVYAYPHTAPIEDDPANREVIEMWCDAGHHVGNHTHCHACLNWVDAGTYCDDIKRAEEVIGDLVERAPIKTFRYTMDMSGQTEAKRGIVEDFLRANGYTTAPITAWFGDFAWTAPYQRAVDNGDDDAAAMLRQAFIDAAIEETAAHAKATREMFGAPIPYLWLIHATPIAQDVMSELLQALKNAGATLVPFTDAVGNVVHRALPPASGMFRNHLQRYAMAAGVEVERDPQRLFEVLTAALPEGENPMAVYDVLIQRMNDRIGGTLDWSWE